EDTATDRDIPSEGAFLVNVIFSDGRFNWGRVVALFYFACRLVIKGLIIKMADVNRTIINRTIDYLQYHVINWIREQGAKYSVNNCCGLKLYLFIFFRREFVPTSALPLGRRWGFSWPVFLPLL
uniref:Bcl-2 Bcl-2 homology region 1-3 domain-containing protein n=1 Tax=Poecilia reticulata TaxID=8081 RepID=A0A3P9PIH7_POERE